MRQYCRIIATNGVLSRENIITILTSLLFSNTVKIPLARHEQWCLRVIGKRTLLVNSLISFSKSPANIGRLILFDVNVGDISADGHGLIKPRVSEHLMNEFIEKSVVENI